MKKFVLIVMTVLPFVGFPQDGKYTVTGVIGNYNAPAKVYIQYLVNSKVNTDSATLKDGKFQFSGTVGIVPVNGYLIFNEKGTGANYKDYKSIYIEKGTTTVTTADLLANAKIEGTKTNEENVRYEAIMKPIFEEERAVELKKSAATPEQKESEEFEREMYKA